MYKKKKTLAGKMIWSFSLIFMLLLILVSAIILTFTNVHFQEQSHDFLKDLAQSHIDSLDNNFIQLQQYAQFVATNKDIREAVYYRNNTATLDYAIELLNLRNVDEKLVQLNAAPNVSNAIIIGSQGKLLYSMNGDVKTDYNFSGDEWFKEFERDGRASGHTSYFTGFHKMNYLLKRPDRVTISMLTPIPNKIPYITFDDSYIMTDIDLSLTLVDATREHDVQIGIYAADDWLLAPQLHLLNETQKQELQSGIASKKDYFFVKSGDWKTPDFLVVTNTSKTTGWQIVGIKNLQSIRDVEMTIFLFIIMLLFISGIIISLASVGISKTILIPMNSLIKKFNKVAEGDYAVRFSESSSEEITRLSLTAQYMISNIVKLSNEVLLEQEKSAAVQLKVLQNQINPHFLNNVLQTIKGFAVTNEVDKISEMTTLLGKILTYTTYEPFKKVEISTELKHIENYIATQNIRFDNKIFYSVLCERQWEEFLIPKLIIQPLVENAIEHGFVNKRSGLIFISVEEDDSQLNIIVTDDGEGFDETEVSQLNEDLQYKDSYSSTASIGLLNVSQRIKKEYGEHYGLRVVSKKSNGTSAIITLPKE